MTVGHQRLSTRRPVGNPQPPPAAGGAASAAAEPVGTADVGIRYGRSPTGGYPSGRRPPVQCHALNRLAYTAGGASRCKTDRHGLPYAVGVECPSFLGWQAGSRQASPRNRPSHGKTSHLMAISYKRDSYCQVLERLPSLFRRHQNLVEEDALPSAHRGIAAALFDVVEYLPALFHANLVPR